MAKRAGGRAPAERQDAGTSTNRPSGRSAGGGSGRGSITATSRLFDADRSDREIELTPSSVSTIPDRCLLWVDGVGDDAEAIDSLLETLGLDSTAADVLGDERAAPSLQLHGTHFRLRVATIETREGRERASALRLIAGRNFVLTLHDRPIDFMADFDARIKRDTSLGQIDSAAFAAVMLDLLVTSYLRLADTLETEVDRLDGEALRPTAHRDLLGDLVALRHRIAVARRALTNHREVFAALARPDFEAIAGTTSVGHLQAVSARFERAIDAVEAARDALVGTFDIHASRTAQRTNDIVKILTMVSVLLLPTTVIAGFMGMNIKAPYSNDDPSIFWFVVLAIAAIAAGTLIVLRVRRWL